MIVVGGGYHERCRDPSSNRFAGSGVRAAAVLTAVDPEGELVAALDETEEAVAEATCAGLRVRRRRWVRRTGAVSFEYETPLSRPVMFGTGVTATEPVTATGDSVLMFGMLEAVPQVEARTLIVDPQHSLTVDEIRGQAYERLAVVANRAEISALGADADLERAARNVLVATRAEIVAVKLGALGVLVVAGSETWRVGPVVTGRMWPIGSGDAFSAGFAWGYTHGADPPQAAAVGCSTAAWWCSTQSLPAPVSAFEALPQPPPDRPPRVYLAGPFFDMGQRWLIELVNDALRDLGAEVFSPLHDVGNATPGAAQADLAGLETCDSMIALLDGSDPGTVFEVGWATDHGIPVAGFCQRGDPEALTMISGSGTTVYDDLSSSLYAAIWAGLG